MLMSVLKAARRETLVFLVAAFFSTAASAADSSLISLQTAMSDLVDRLSQSVVTVETSHQVANRYVKGAGDQALLSLVCSGIVWDSSGYVLTSASSLAGREQLRLLYQGHSVSAQTVGVDYQSGLALLKADQPVGIPVTVSGRPGCSGQMVIAMGNAYGVRSSPTIGFCAGRRPDDLMQFSASITAGTVGGGLFDLSGGLLGIITGGIGSSDRAEVGLAVEVMRIPEVVHHLKNHGSRLSGYVGVRTAEIEIYPPLHLSFDGRFAASRAVGGVTVSHGIVVTDVVQFSPASQAGLKEGDVLFGLNSQKIESAIDLMQFVRRAIPGTRLRFDLIRGSKTHSVILEVGHIEPEPFDGVFSSGSTYGWEDGEGSALEQVRSLKREILRLESQLLKSGR